MLTTIRRTHTGLLISNIDIDIIDDTFDVSISISTILSYKSIDRGIDDTLLAFLSTLHQYFSTDMQNDAHNFLSFRAFVRVQRSVEILDERRITSINQSSFISGMTERRPRMRNKHNIHSNNSRVTCLIGLFVFIEHSCNEVSLTSVWCVMAVVVSVRDV